MNDTFYYSLRFTLDPKFWSEQKEDELIDFCKNARIDNVCFFINPEELNQGHQTRAERQIWLDAILPISEKLKRLNISTSLNPWTTLMHSDRGTTVNPKLGFSTMVDYLGNRSSSIACPADEKWQNYMVDAYIQYASIHPKELWFEDDFRHYNHTPIKLGCFCEKHMEIYSKLLGRTISREEFVKAVLRPGKPTKERRIYLDVARKEMIDVAQLVKKAVSNVSSDTRLSLMSSFPDWHAVEGRDWQGLFNALSGTQIRVSRPHLPAYNEVSPLRYSRDFDRYTRITTMQVGEEADLYPELENYMYSQYAKSSRFTQFQLESSTLSGANGILLNLFDMIGNGIDSYFDYARMLRDSKDWLNFSVNNRISLSNISGIKILINQDSAYTIQTENGTNPTELLPKESEWLSLVSALGFSTSPVNYSEESKDLENEVIAVSGQLLRNLTDQKIVKLFSNNFVLLDGESVSVLKNRSLLNLVKATDATWIKARSGKQSYEEFSGSSFDGIENPRVTLLQHVGDYLKIDYKNSSQIKVLSQAYTASHERVGPVMVLTEKSLIMPIGFDDKYGWEGEYHTIKEHALKQALQEFDLPYLVDMPGVKLVVEGEKIYISNFTTDLYDGIKLHLSDENESYTINFRKKDEVINEVVQCSWNNGVGKIDYQLSPMETILILKK